MTNFLGFEVFSQFIELQNVKNNLFVKNWFDYFFHSQFEQIYDSLILEEKIIEIKCEIEKEFNSKKTRIGIVNLLE